MKTVAVLFTLVVASLAQSPIGDIDWTNVEPMWQNPLFFDAFPILRWIINRDRDPETNGFIIGGEPALDEQFPWSVGLIFHTPTSNAFCGGTLLSNEWILTAAHCAQLSFSGVAIMGSRNIMNSSDVNQRRMIFETRFVYPQWNPENFRHDIALVQLTQPVELSDFIQPARMPNVRQLGNLFTNQRGTINGWGNFRDSVADEMHFIRSQIMSRLSCTLNYPGLVHFESVCTNGERGMSPCQGDSGAPLSIEEADSQKTVIGLLSFGSGLGCLAGRPAVYTLVGPYMQWISTSTGIPIRPTF